MRVNKREIKRRNKEIRVRDREENRAVDSGVAGVGGDVGLDGDGGVAADVAEGRVSDVELGDEGGEAGGPRRRGGHVAVVGPRAAAGVVPLQEDLAPGVRERVGAVLGDGGGAVLGAVDAVDGVEARVGVGDVAALERVRVRARRLVPNLGAVDAGWVRLVEDA